MAEEIQDRGPSHIHQNEVEDPVEENPTADHQCQQEEDTLEAGKSQRKALVSEYLVSVCIQLSVNWTKSSPNLVHCKRSKLCWMERPVEAVVLLLCILSRWTMHELPRMQCVTQKSMVDEFVSIIQ